MRNVNVDKSVFIMGPQFVFRNSLTKRAKLVEINEFSWFNHDCKANEWISYLERAVFGKLFLKNILIGVLLSMLWRWHQIETGSCSRAVLSGILCSNWMPKHWTSIQYLMLITGKQIDTFVPKMLSTKWTTRYSATNNKNAFGDIDYVHRELHSAHSCDHMMKEANFQKNCRIELKNNWITFPLLFRSFLYLWINIKMFFNTLKLDL